MKVPTSGGHDIGDGWRRPLDGCSRGIDTGRSCARGHAAHGTVQCTSRDKYTPLMKPVMKIWIGQAPLREIFEQNTRKDPTRNLEGFQRKTINNARNSENTKNAARATQGSLDMLGNNSARFGRVLLVRRWQKRCSSKQSLTSCPSTKKIDAACAFKRSGLAIQFREDGQCTQLLPQKTKRELCSSCIETKNEATRRNWYRQIRRDDSQPPANHVVCGRARTPTCRDSSWLSPLPPKRASTYQARSLQG